MAPMLQHSLAYLIGRAEISLFFIRDNSLRKYIIKQPLFIDRSGNERIYGSFEDGYIISTMDICGPYIPLRIYIDGFGTNNAIGTARDNHKLVGVYYSGIDDTKVGSQRSTITMLGLVNQSDVDFFGLAVCLAKIMSELRDLVVSGIYDKRLKKWLQVRIIANLGDNLGRHSITI